MKKQIVATLIWTLAYTILLCAVYHFNGSEDWLMRAIMWAIPTGTGYFLGYGQCRRDN